MMQQPSSLSLASATPSLFQPVTLARKDDFFALLNGQARMHGAGDQKTGRAAEALYRAIVTEKRAEALLVVCPNSLETLGTATYYDNLTSKGSGLYLEDMFVAETARGKGVGQLAMQALAQIAVHRQAQALVWECAANNADALRFYRKLGGIHHSERTTWRRMGAAFPDREPAVDVQTAFKLAAAPITLRHHRALAPHPHFIQITAQVPQVPNCTILQAYKNFSTFRRQSGLHIESVSYTKPDAKTFEAALYHVARMQHNKGWHHHTDFTLRSEQSSLLQPVLEKHGFAPLSYAGSAMLTLSLSGESLRNLSTRAAVSVPPELLTSPHTPLLRMRPHRFSGLS